MEKKREKEVVCDWEFKVPLTISVVTHYDLGCAEASKVLGTLSKDDVYNAFKKALFHGKGTYKCPHWVYHKDTAPEEGVYLRELTYNEKYRGKQTEEIPIPLWIDDEK